ncbi:MAG: response regulator [Chloroflexi bacterium]|nr:response regulator [Chloroflexota bacterium]
MSPQLLVPQLLVVDDDRPIREVITEALTDEGYGVHTAADAREAVAQLRRIRPDLVIADVAIPYGDGISLCRMICRTPDPVPTPVVVISALAHPALVNRAYQAGAAAFLAKPFDLDELVECIRRLLAQPPASREAVPSSMFR